MKHQYLNLLKTIWEFAKGMRTKFVLIYLMFVVANLIMMFEPYLLGKFLNVVQEGGDNVVMRSAMFLGAYALLSFFFWTLHGPARCMERVVAFKIYTNFSKKMFEIITKLPLKWHKDHHSGNTIHKVNRAARALQNFLDEGYIYIEAIVPFVASLVAIFIIMKWSGLYLLLTGGIVFAVIFRFDKFLTASLREINRREHKVAAVFFDYMSNISTIITLRLEKLAKNEYLKKIRHVLPIFSKNVVSNEGKWFVVDMIMMSSFFFIIMLYVYQAFETGDTLMAGTLIMLYGYVKRFNEVFYGLAWKYEKLVVTSTNLTTVEGILKDYDDLYSSGKFKTIHKDWKKIEIRDLCFSYQDEKHRTHALKDINIDLKKGLKIALVGESGGGKSTLMTVLRGLSMANKIEMNVDGKKVDDLRALSDTTTLFPQDPEIFENTIEYNITMGIAHRNRDVQKAVTFACFDKVVKKLPKGLESSIREKGVNLSGGEKQRLALARGIFASKASSIVLLDEPTSSVDSANEMQIYENLLELFKDKCVISSIHRLHLLSMFDIVYVINKGKIVEKGSFKELVKSNGNFAKLWSKYSQQSPTPKPV